jgi:hypothetical protein
MIASMPANVAIAANIHAKNIGLTKIVEEIVRDLS